MIASLNSVRRASDELLVDAEWETRVNLAALYRMAALYGWDDLVATHISPRVPGSEHHFLLNPFGLMFEKVTASSLVKVDAEKQQVDPGNYGINCAGFVIHSAIHAARPDAKFIIHFHMADGMSVSAHKEGLLSLNQRALTVIPSPAYHDYEGIALSLDERERLVADLGEAHFMLLRNHGTLALGASAGAAWRRIYQIETACTAQVRTLLIGRHNVLLAPATAQETVRQQIERTCRLEEGSRDITDLIWEVALRKVERLLPGCRS